MCAGGRSVLCLLMVEVCFVCWWWKCVMPADGRCVFCVLAVEVGYAC